MKKIKSILCICIMVCITSCGLFQSKKVYRRPIKNNPIVVPYISKRVRHFNCIDHFLKRDVAPKEANEICISIYRK